MQTASILSMMANRYAKKGTSYTPDDFIPYRELEDTAFYKRRKAAVREFNERRKKKKK